MPEVKGRNFYDRGYFEAITRESLPHTREVIYPLCERTARALCRRLSPRYVLDVGCAKGFLVEAFRACGVPAVFGTDISHYAIAEGSTAVRDHLVIADAQVGLPFRSGSFDLIAALDLFEHLSDARPALEEIRRVLSATGVAYLKICHPAHPNARRDPSHVNVQPLAYWHQAFRQADFEWQRLYEAEFAPSAGRGEFLRDWVRRWREWAVIGTPADYKFLLRKRRHG